MDAPQLTLVDGVATGDGGVRLQIDADLIEGARFALNLDTAVLTVHDGTWTRLDGTLTFEQAEVELEDLTGVILRGAFHGAQREIAVSGEELVVVGPGELTGRRVNLTLCSCEQGPQPWRVTARRVRVRLDDEVSFTGGWIRVFEVPLIPVPAGQLPLRRRSGLLPPSLGYGQDGWRATLPVYLTLGKAADLTLTPALRTERSLRLLSEFRYAVPGGRGQLDGAFGTDWKPGDEGLRGAGSWTHTWSRGPWVSAVRAQLTSDEDYLEDYGDAFLTRQTPWTEVRALAGWHGLEAWTDGFDGAEQALHQAVGLGWRQGARALPGGLLLGGDAWGTLRTRGDRFIAPELAGLAGGAALSLTRPVRAGPVVFTPALEGQGRLQDPLVEGQTELASALWGTAALEARLLAWRASSRAYERLEPTVGVQVAASTTTGALDPWLVMPGRWEASAGVTYRRTPRGGGLTELGATAVTSPSGLSGRALGQISGGPLSGWLQLRTQPWQPGAPQLRDTALGTVLQLATAGASVGTGPLTVSTAWWWAERSTVRQPTTTERDVHQSELAATWTLPGPLSALTLGGGVRLDWWDGQTLSNRVSLAYVSPCDCLTIRASTRIDSDRALPDVAVQITLE